MSILITLLIILIVSIVSYKLIIWFQARQGFFKKLQKIPGPKQVFLFGNALDFKSFADVLPVISRYQKEHGLTFKVQMGPNPYVFTADPQLIKCITTSNTQITKSISYKYLMNWIGDGLITSNEPRWSIHRRIITPTFHFNIIKNFLPIFHKNANNLIDHWKNIIAKTKTSQSKPFDVYEDILASALDSICETAMGISVNALKDGKHSNYTQTLKFMGANVMDRSLSFWKQFDFLYKLTPTYRKEIKMLRYIKNITEEIIKRKRDEINHNNLKPQQEDLKDDGLGIKKRVAFLDRLMASMAVSGSSMSDEELREEVDTFIFAGHDTTASAISFVLYYLAANQDVQQKCYNEVMVVLDGDNSISCEKLPDLKYLDMCIKESLRIAPIAPMFVRTLTEDVIHKGQIFPAGLNLAVYVYGAHRNEEIFPEPERFDPERFTPDAISKRNAFAYVPFSAGPRNCIGQKFAMVEMTSLLASLLKEFKFIKPNNMDVQPVAQGVLKSLNGVKLVVKLRD